MRRLLPLVALVVLLIACGEPPRPQDELPGSRFVLSDMVATPTLNRDIAPTQTRAAELAQIATLTTPTATATTPPPTPTIRVPPTIPAPTLTTKQLSACDRVAGYYAQKGRVFDRATAARDPEAAFFDFRIVKVGTAAPPLNRLARFGYEMDRALLWECLGLPPPPITPLT